MCARLPFAVGEEAVYPEPMLKWLFTTALALVVLTGAMPWLARRFGIGRMPGDFRFTLGGRDYILPLTSTALLSLLAWLLGRLI